MTIDSGVISFSDLKDLGITLRGIALIDHGNHRHDRYSSYDHGHVSINVNERTLYEEALKQNKYNFESIRRLTVDQQRSIEVVLDHNNRRIRRLTDDAEMMVLPQVLSVSICKNRRRRLFDILKSLTPLQAGIHGPARSSVYVVMASVEIPPKKKLTYRDDRYRRYDGLKDDIDMSPVRRPRSYREHARPRARFSTAEPSVLQHQGSYERVRPLSERVERIEREEEEDMREREAKERNRGKEDFLHLSTRTGK